MDKFLFGSCRYKIEINVIRLVIYFGNIQTKSAVVLMLFGFL
jgi:hypothetical protein